MKLIWTKSKLPLSALIRWGLNTDCSHFAIVFNSPAGGLMFESNLVGTHPKFYKNASKHMEVVHEIDLTIDVELENKIWDLVVDRFDDRGYDFGAFFYFCWRGILKRLFKKPMPKKNRWAKNDKFLCGEVCEVLVDCGLLPALDLDLAMSSPHDIYEKLLYLHIKTKN